MIISLHIPKTAGTSFRLALQEEYKDRLLFDTTYIPNTNSPDIQLFLDKYGFDRQWPYLSLGFLVGERRCQPLRRIYRRLARSIYFCVKRGLLQKDLANLAAKYEIVHGHFPLRKYLGIFPDAAICTFFREPFDHFHSLYYHLYRHPWHDANSHAADPSYLIHEKGYSLVDFAASPYAQTLYKSYLNQVPIERFDFIGLTEEYSLSLRLYNAIFGTQLKAHHQNKNPDKDGPEYMESHARDSRRIKEMLHRQQILYDQAKSRFDKLCRKYL